MRLGDFSSAGLAALLALAAACTPVFNWREVPVDDGLSGLLPCKPDRGERTFVLGDATVTLAMAGCEAGGATFAIAHMPGGDPAQAEARLRAWREAARAPWTGAGQAEPGWSLPGAAAAPAPAAWTVNGKPASGGPPTQAQWRWFARADRQGRITLYQATVLGMPSAPDAAATFFEGLRLQ